MQSLHMSVVLFMITLLGVVFGHGYLKDPPSRSSMWKFGFNTPVNYNDNQLFCGGRQKQQSFDGKCGVCGDPYDQATPRDNEAGGKYAKGIITKNYTTGSTVDITVRITANHLGFFEFRLCENNDINKTVTKECLKHLLVNETGGTKHYIGATKGDIVTRVRLPENVACSQCVLQWRYHTGNSWGTGDEGSCVGCGPQEEFYGCSDIAILSSGVTNTATSFGTSTLSAILKTSSTTRTTKEAKLATTSTTTTTTPAAATTTTGATPTTTTTPAATTTTATTPATTTTVTTPAAVTTATTTTTTQAAATTTSAATTTTTTTPAATTTFTPAASTTLPTTTSSKAPAVTTRPTTTTSSNNQRVCVSLVSPATNFWCNVNCNHVPPYCPSHFCSCT